MPVWSALGAGVLAGLAIALPLGAIGVLIVREAVERGLRAAVGAAAGVASVDFLYACAAVLLGDRVSATLAGWERAVSLLGAFALLLVVVHGLRGVWRSARVADSSGPTDPEVGQDPSGGRGRAREALPTSHVYLRFVALTAINPMTAVYFVALTAGLSEALSAPVAGAAFAVGVLVGSLAWQLVLAGLGALMGGQMSERFRIGVSVAGYAIVAGYAVKLAVGA